MAQQFGAQQEDEQGNLLDIKLQPEYLEALKFYNKLYTEGLITTMNSPRIRRSGIRKWRAGRYLWHRAG